jgi:putative ABC transport system permease protein
VTAIEATSEEWLALDGVVRRLSPEASVTTVRGTPEGDGVWYDVSYAPPQGRTNGHHLLEWAGGSLGTMNLVAERVPDTFPDLSEQGRRDANGALAAGQVVVFSAAEVDADTVRIRANRWNETAGAEERVIGPVTVPARYVVVEGSGAPVKAILPPAVAEGIGMPSVTTALLVHGTDLSEQTEADLQQAVAAETTYGSVYVERGYQPSASDRLVLWVLGGLGAVLMLGGTLTATFLALTDARPDLATLAAVGATPRTRRSVAASSALVVGGIGAVLGALVGLVPGIAVTYPLTTVSGVWSGEGPGAMSFDGQPPQTGPFLEIPWLMVAVIVVGLPLVTAALIGILTRSRLPMVSRLE